MKKTTPRYIYQILKTSDNAKIIKATKENKKTHYVQGNKDKITAYYSLETMQAGKKVKQNFKVLKEKYFQNKTQRWRKYIFRLVETKRIHHHYTHTIRNIKGSLQAEKKMIPDRNTDSHK